MDRTEELTARAEVLRGTLARVLKREPDQIVVEIFSEGDLDRTEVTLKGWSPDHHDMVKVRNIVQCGEDWDAPWKDHITGKQFFSLAPDFSGLDPDTGELWSPRKVASLMGLTVMSRIDTLAACRVVLTKNQDKADQYRAGKVQLMGFFMKALMEETSKRANPSDGSRILKALLEGKAQENILKDLEEEDALKKQQASTPS